MSADYGVLASIASLGNEVLTLRKQCALLRDAIEEALEFIDDYADVVDGDYGEQKPNRAMSVGNSLREALRQRS